jgi:hypothetical protein
MEEVYRRMRSRSLFMAATLLVTVALAGCSSVDTSTSDSKQIKSAVAGSTAKANAKPADPSTTAAAPDPTTIAPDPLVKPVKFSGSSDSIQKIKGGLTEARILTVSASGDGNFAIEELGSKGDMIGLLVNAIGNYRGVTLVLPEDGAPIAAFKITASGPWTATLADVRTAAKWDAKKVAKGSGDQVLIIPGGTGDLETVKFSNKGAGNFAVYATGDSSRDLLVNQIGTWSGTEALPSGTVLIDLVSDGAWSITPVA